MRASEPDECELAKAVMNRCKGFGRGLEFQLPQRYPAVEFCARAQLLLDAQQLVVLRNSIRARSRTSLDLPRRCGHRQIRDKCILRLSRTVRNDRVVSGFARQFDGV